MHRGQTVEEDHELITNSLLMLPSWEQGGWWRQFSKISGHSREYLAEKLAFITVHWNHDPTDLQGGERAKYVLFLLDNPALYEHLDAADIRSRDLRSGYRICR